ncbi:hypothetical protein [Nonomuraea sp. NPDC050202]|uniref:hypothetical protein n=1 Tax=Nonomuraea sp. NPDC050202 TaxID=3155035 RepID=UPI0033D9CDBF
MILGLQSCPIVEPRPEARPTAAMSCCTTSPSADGLVRLRVDGLAEQLGGLDQGIRPASGRRLGFAIARGAELIEQDVGVEQGPGP